MNLNRVHPLLLNWARHYGHLREVTTADVIAATGPLPASQRRQTLTALRSLFGHARKTGTIFRDPTRGVRDGQRPLILIQPLQPAQIDQATAAAVTPAARLAVALAAVHAARPKTIRELHPRRRRPRQPAAGHHRPGPPARRPDQAPAPRLAAAPRPPLARHRQPAPDHQPADRHDHPGRQRELADQSMPRPPATLERLRVDRQLEEALTCGADPLHLAAVFGIDDTTAIKYAAIALQLLQTAAEQHDPSGSREPEGQDSP